MHSSQFTTQMEVREDGGTTTHRKSISNVKLLNNTLCDYERVQNYDKVIQIFEQYVEISKPNIESLNTMIRIYGKLNQWEKSIDVLSAMKSKYQVDPNIISYNSAIFSCWRSKEWGSVLNIYEMMKYDKRGKVLKRMDRPLFSTLCMVLEAHVQLEDVKNALLILDVFTKNNIKPRGNEYSQVMALCDKDPKHFDVGIDVMRKALSRGSFSKVWNSHNSHVLDSDNGDGRNILLLPLLQSAKKSFEQYLKIDLHGCTAATARTLLRLLIWELKLINRTNSKHMVDSDNAQNFTLEHDLMVVTGVGHHSWSGGVLKGVAREFFKLETSIPVTEVDGYANQVDEDGQGRGTNEGRFILKKRHLVGDFIHSSGLRFL